MRVAAEALPASDSARDETSHTDQNVHDAGKPNKVELENEEALHLDLKN